MSVRVVLGVHQLYIMRIDLRHELFQNASDVNTNSEFMSDSKKLIFLLKTDILQTKIASTLLQMNRRRRSTVIR